MKDRIVELAEEYICNTGMTVFLTGKAGTGKTTFLKHLVETTAKRHVVIAPTGVAAVNAGGVTIHSFFQLPLCPYLPDVKELITEYQMPEAKRQLRKEKLEIIRTLDLIIIDEISMVRADLLDAMDDVLRKVRHDPRPFGGVQMLMIGDIQQLPPVLTDAERPYFQQVYPSPFFFDAKVMTRLRYVTIELQTIYRQQDADFVRVLNNVRDGRFDSYTSQSLASRLKVGFEPDRNDSGWIRLCTHNAAADSINRSKLRELKSREYTFDAELDGTFPENNAPAEMKLCLKEGAQVMFIRNDRQGRYFNGKTGIITEIDSDGITVTDSDGQEINVEIEKWENVRYEIDPKDSEIKPIVQGTFSQYPLRLAWAITIHKSQGLTFDRVIIDAAAAFSFGQVYVALSRCRTLDGIVLSSPISSSCVFGNESVSGFCNAIPDATTVEKALDSEKQSYHFSLLKECFDLRPLRICMERVDRIFQNDIRKISPKQASKFAELTSQMCGLSAVSEKFCTQIDRIEASCGGNNDDAFLKERSRKAAEYFAGHLTDLVSQLPDMLTIDIDNKETAKRLKDNGHDLLTEAGIRLKCFTLFQKEDFSVESYHRCKVDTILNSMKTDLKPKKQKKSKRAAEITDSPFETDHDIYLENRHPELVEALTEWRRVQCRKQEVPAYFILSQKTLLGIADAAPRTQKALMAIHGFGKAKWEQYGEQLLELIEDNVIW